MGKKYIIEIPEDKIADFVGSTHFLMPYMMAGHIGHHDTGLPIKPYTEPDLEQIRKEAFEEGKKQAKVQAELDVCHDIEKVAKENYKAGLADAWEATKKIALMDTETSENVTGYFGLFNIMNNLTASEAIAKIKEYEDSKQEIKVGDEVGWIGDRYTVTYIDVDETYADLIDCSCGSVCERIAIKDLDKTGRHFPEIASVLQKMRGEQE